MAWHDLIAHLGTLTINEVALPLGEHRTIQMLARPAALQEQAFALLAPEAQYTRELLAAISHPRFEQRIEAV